MSPVLRTLIFTILVAGLWTVALPYWLLPPGSQLHLGGVGFLGALLAAAGAALYLTCAFWGFAIRGKGTPAPIDPPKKLVVEGPYRVVRNPMYWSVVSAMLGEACLFRSLALAGALGSGILRRRKPVCHPLRGARAPPQVRRRIRRLLSPRPPLAPSLAEISVTPFATVRDWLH